MCIGWFLVVIAHGKCMFQIAVFSSNVRSKGDAGSGDHLAAQLHPTGDWGTKFALAPVLRSTNIGDTVRVIGM